MESRKLYIIGNGFDLWHGIPSKYKQFKEFVKQQDIDLLRDIKNYLSADEEWNELESALAEIDIDHIIEDHGHLAASYGGEDWSDSGHHDFQYEVGCIVERLSKGLRHQFARWIWQLPIPTPTTTVQRLRSIDPMAHFLSFNYTSTLQYLYSVPDKNVLHIHGKVNLLESDLVLGHAWTPQKSLNDRPDIEDIDSRLVEVNQILDEYFSKTFKPSARLIQENLPFFMQLTNLEKVCVLGHSLSAIDEIYFLKLLAMPGVASAQWQIAYRPEDEDSLEKSARLLELGVQANCITTCLWSDI